MFKFSSIIHSYFRFFFLISGTVISEILISPDDVWCISSWLFCSKITFSLEPLPASHFYLSYSLLVISEMATMLCIIQVCIWVEDAYRFFLCISLFSWQLFQESFWSNRMLAWYPQDHWFSHIFISLNNVDWQFQIFS